MEYTSLESQKYYANCQDLIKGLGYSIVELCVVPNKSQFQVRVVITHKIADLFSDVSIGVNDCAKVHRLLLPYFEERLHSEEVYIEVTSPGMERTIKNAAEFALFIGRQIKVWDTLSVGWISGILSESTTDSLTLRLTGVEEVKTLTYVNIAKAKLLYLGD